MTSAERRASLGLASIFGLRMLGLFFIMPVFTLYADKLTSATPLLIGLGLGAYGLTQAIFQVPMGMASDRIGRKPIIIGGLVVFAVGSAVAAMSTSIYGVIIGRALQGCGAIAAAIMALAADVTRESQRTKIMAFLGISVGVAFMLALIIAPSIAYYVGLEGIFWATAVLALVSMCLLFWFVPGRHERSHDREIRPGSLRQALRHPDLIRLDLSVLALHLILTASFIVLPKVIENSMHVPASEQWKVYIPVMLVSAGLLFPAVSMGESKGMMHRLVAAMVIVLAIGELALADTIHVAPWAIGVALVVYFTAFNVLESSLPSLVSRFAPVDAKGAALGVFSTCQFIGAFLGGLSGGIVYGHFGVAGTFQFCAVVAVLWFFAVLGLHSPGPQNHQAADSEYTSA
ncbi:MAG TPA: MFS transporter [Nitrococcus sp.]|nr:MFS transporter [Nitrococcus sp.]